MNSINFHIDTDYFDGSYGSPMYIFQFLYFYKFYVVNI